MPNNTHLSLFALLIGALAMSLFTVLTSEMYFLVWALLFMLAFFTVLIANTITTHTLKQLSGIT